MRSQYIGVFQHDKMILLPIKLIFKGRFALQVSV